MSSGASGQPSPKLELFLRAIAEKKKQNPLAGLEIGAAEVNKNLIDELKDARGVHIETFLAVLAALGGFACQMSLRAEIGAGSLTEAQAFTIAEGKDGRRYFFGDNLNARLAEGPHSIWSFVAGAAQHLGSSDLPDLEDIFAHVAATVGGADFGKPRYPEGHAVPEPPALFIRSFWPKAMPILQMFCDSPAEWPMLFGIALQKAMIMGKDALAPALAVKIAMEVAVPMSKVDPVDVQRP